MCGQKKRMWVEKNIKHSGFKKFGRTKTTKTHRHKMDMRRNKKKIYKQHKQITELLEASN